MAYQLRSRGDPVTTESQEQTDTLKEYLTEHQVTTTSQVEFISPQLSTIQSVATATAEANRALATSDISTKPDVGIHPQLDIQGPTRPDPDLDSAPSTASPSSTGTHLTTQQPAPAQASAFISVQSSLAEEVGPPSTVDASRDYIPTTNQTLQLHDTINSLLLLSKHDRQEVKQTETRDITLESHERFWFCKVYRGGMNRHERCVVRLDNCICWCVWFHIRCWHSILSVSRWRVSCQ